jgi:hypothetical protein
MLIAFITIFIVAISVTIFFFMKNSSSQKKKMGDNNVEYISATEVMEENLKDPVIVSRAYFTEDKLGDLGNFTGYSSVSEDHWLHGFPHEKAQ